MKEIKVNCTLYLEVEDDSSIDEALEKVMFYIDPNLAINVYGYEFEEV